MKYSTLGEILTDEQCKAVCEIVNKHQDSIERVAALKKYLRTLDADLQAKEIYPDYLAYVIEANVTRYI